MANYTTTAQPMLNELSRTAAFFNGLRTRFHERRMYRQMLNGLSALTNRELADLGLSRSELHRVAHETSRANG